MRTACFTGHRDVKFSQNMTQRLSSILRQLIQNGVEDFYAGGALGFDMIAERTVIMLREQYPQIKLHLILPCPKEEQTLRWNKAEKEEFNNIQALADTVEICSPVYHTGCMKERNQRLVDLADICICYYNENHSRSGTGQTVHTAQKKGIQLINIFSC